MRTKTGVVVSNKMDKTIVVSVDAMKRDPKYKKSYKVTTKFYAHDEANSCVEGEKVVIKETRPLSKMKRWELLEKIA